MSPIRAADPFDSTKDDLYSFAYLGETPANAVAETLLRDLPVDDAGPRILPLKAVRGRKISALVVMMDLTLVSLRTGPELGAVSQDNWLTGAEPRDYPQTRHWGHWLRRQAVAACGYVWQSKREPYTNSFVLFGDRTSPGALVPKPSDPLVPDDDRADFDTLAGRAELRRRLAAYNVIIVRL